MRLVYFGTSSFAVPALDRLKDHVVLVVSQPDRPSGRGMKMRPTPVKEAAQRHGLPVEAPLKSRAPEFVERLKELDADAFVVASYGQILSKALLDVPKVGAFNLHASILPSYRGASPIQYAVLNGDTETGVTLMQMDEGMDTGDVIAIEKTRIGPDETAGELHDRLAAIAADIIQQWIERLAGDKYTRTPQDGTKATKAPKTSKADAELSFDRDAKREYDRYRAFTPVPGAFLKTTSGTLKIKRATPAVSTGEAPGSVVAVRPGLVVAFAGGAICLEEVQPEGRRQVSGSEFANGARLKPGDCLKPTRQ